MGSTVQHALCPYAPLEGAAVLPVSIHCNRHNLSSRGATVLKLTSARTRFSRTQLRPIERHTLTAFLRTLNLMSPTLIAQKCVTLNSKHPCTGVPRPLKTVIFSGVTLLDVKKEEADVRSFRDS